MIVEKYSASGNDFLIFNQGWSGENQEIKIAQEKRAELARLLCHRFRGIGADGLVILSPHSQYPYQWDFYNSDGSKALMCGNASRCVGLYALKHHFAGKRHYFLSGAGEIGIEIINETYPYFVKSLLGEYRLLEKKEGWVKFDTGVPHLIKLGSKSEFEALSVREMKNLREEHNANVNIAYQDGDVYRIKTYERGVEDITQACGTGMASLVALLREKEKDNGVHLTSQKQKTIIIPPSGERLEFELEGKKIAFSGEVKKIAKCQIDLREFGVENEQ